MNPITSALSKGAGSVALKVTIVAVAALGGTGMVTSNVFAALTATATNTSGGQVTSGTLKLTMAPSGVSGITNGFTTAIANIGPGDTYNRYVDLTNGGTLDGMTPTLQLVTSDTSTLSESTTAGLQIAIAGCSQAFTNLGACGGTPTTVLTSTSAKALKTSATSITLPTLLAAGVSYLKVSVSLPASTENVLNGVLPSGTIQGLTANLTWTFVITDSSAIPAGVNS
ncbi:Peptidase M73, camelysin [Candidatus Nanopelagicaceae bacterium]